MSDLKDKIMSKIQGDEVKMRSKSFFIFLKALGELFLIFSAVFVVYFINLSFYLPKRELMRGAGRKIGPGPVINIIPWHYVIIAIILFSLAAWIIFKYTDFYKKNRSLWIGLFVIAVLFFGYILTMSGVNERLENRRNFERLYGPPRMMQREKLNFTRPGQFPKGIHID